MKRKSGFKIMAVLLAAMIAMTPVYSAQADVQFVENTEYAQEWLEENEYQEYPGWAVDVLIDLYLENEAKFELTYTEQRYAITGAVMSIESDYAILITAGAYESSMSYYYIKAYLPKEQLAELTKGYCITVVGDFTVAEAEDPSEDEFFGVFSEPILEIRNAEIYIPEKDTEYAVGDTASTDNFEVTIETAEYVYGVSLDSSSDNFALPLTAEEFESAENGIRVSNEDYSIMSFTLTYKFTGNEPISNFVSVPILYSDYCALTAEAAVFEQLYDGSWGKLGTSMTNSYQNNFGIGDINFSLRSFDPDGENNEIAVRGFIIVPNDVAEDDDPLMLYLNGFDIAFQIQ